MGDAPVVMPTYDRLMWPTLRALKELGGSGSNQETDLKVAELERFSEQQLSRLHGRGRLTEIGYRLLWARSYLKTYDAITRSARGVWAITEKGTRLQEGDMPEIPRFLKATYRSRLAQEAASAGETEPDAQLDALLTEGSGESVAGREAPEEPKSWRDVLLDTLMAMSPSGFEHLSKWLLREAGFARVEVTGRSGDGGIDGVGVLKMSLLSFPVFFQCKRYRGTVGAREVRDFRGAMVGRTDKGIMLTTGTFTAAAEREAGRDGAPPIDLINGDRLCDLLKEYGLGVGVEIERVERVSVDPAWFRKLDNSQ